MHRQKNKDISRRSLLKACAVALPAVLAAPVFGRVSAVCAAPPAGKKMLIIYYSRSGNTRAVAEQIQGLTGADIFELKTITPYPKEHRATTEQAKREQESGYRPPLSAKPDNPAAYDIIFIGSPNWWGTLAMPFFTFLEEYKLSGKTVIPFMTHGGSGFGRALADIKALCPDAVLVDGLAIRSGQVQSAQPDITQWLKAIGMLK